MIERLQSWDVGLAKISGPSFRNLPDKLSMPAALDGFKPFKIFNIFSGNVSENPKLKSLNLTLFQDERGKSPPKRFSIAIYTIVGISPHTAVKFQGYTQCQS